MRKHVFASWLAACLLIAAGGCNKSSAPSATDGASSSAASSAPPAASYPASAAQPAPPPPLPPIVVPVRTALTVTLDQSIDTKTNSSGDRFAASLAEPVTVGGVTVIPAGAHATGTVVEADSAGKVKGGALLALTLDSVTVSGQKYQVQTAEFEEAGNGRGKRTAVGAGGGAAFGAIVGALAGGGKGAAIGALAGGGAGTAGAAFTGKRDITLPAETRLHFRLTQPVSINQQ
jgi:hypothetical protein